MRVGDIVEVTLYNYDRVTGPIAHIFKAGQKPSDEDILKYYGMTEEDRLYQQVCVARTHDRIAVLKPSGYHLVVPVTAKLHGSIKVLEVDDDARD